MLRILPMPVAQYKIDGKDLFTSIQMQDYAIDCQEAAKEEKDLMKEVVLVTHKPKREWSGLSVSKAEDLLAEFENDPFEMLFALDKYLREKNT